MKLEYRSITRARTIEEKARRHLHGDNGATFSKGKYMTLSGQVMGAVTTFTTKDCLVGVIYENEMTRCNKPATRFPMVFVDAYSAAKRSRDYAYGMALEIGDCISNSLTQNYEHHLAMLCYER